MDPRRTAFIVSVAIGLALLAVLPAFAVTVTIGATKDNTLFEDSTGAVSNGAGQFMFCGNTAVPLKRRALIAFDIAAAVPGGATIDSVSLTLHLSRRPMLVAVGETVRLRRLLADWGQGTSDAGDPGGGGIPSTPGDATWIHRFFDTDFWTNPGGDFIAMNSAALGVDSIGFYTWGPTALMAADAQGWLSDPGNNFGWIMVGGENAPQRARRFDTSEHDTLEFRPALKIDYTPNPLTDVAGAAGPGGAVRLEPNAPNPFSTRTTFAFTLGSAAPARLTVQDAAGRIVATLVDRVEASGPHSVVWDGRDDRGAPLAAGVYFTRLESAGAVRTREVVLTR